MKQQPIAYVVSPAVSLAEMPIMPLTLARGPIDPERIANLMCECAEQIRNGGLIVKSAIFTPRGVEVSYRTVEHPSGKRRRK